MAIDEMLRYSGIVRRIFRRATANMRLGGITIAEGDLAALMLASANRDPDQFPDPDRLDLTRAAPGHLALGTGTQFVRRGDVDPDGGIGGDPARWRRGLRAVRLLSVGEWRTGSGFCFPESAKVALTG